MRKFTKLLMLFVLCLIGLQGYAQNVTISPNNGSMICALTTDSQATQLGFQIGAFGTWKHEQLSLTMTGSNYKDLTDDGQLESHSNHFITGDKCEFLSEEGLTPKNYIVVDWGGQSLREGYITIALPKGYRFTEYTFHLSHDVTKFGLNNDAFNLTTNTNVTMTETDYTFSGNTNQVTIAPNSSVTNFTRTGDDMGNVLYFRTTAQSNGFYAMTFRYVELKFTADADASIDVLPASQVTSGVSLVEVPFATGKVDLGNIKPGQYQGATRVSYIYDEVSDMSANMLLYEKESLDEITADDEDNFDGTPGYVAVSGSGSITTDGEYFKLNPGSSKEQVYFLETPVYATMSNGDKNPIQFRIVGANIEYTDGSGDSYDEFTISYKSGNTTYYLGNGYGRSTSPTNWFMDEEGYVRCGTNGSRYLTIATSQSWTTTYTYLTTSTREQAQKFKINGNYLQVDGGNYNNYYVSYGAQNWNTYYWRLRDRNNNQPVTITMTGTTATVGGLSSTGSGTLTVYDATGETPVSTERVNSSNKKGYIPLTDLNNDAIKFSVQGTVFVKLNVTLQALNPYIDQMTVVMNDTDNGKNLRMTRTFTADDFSVGGGTFRFYLPTGCDNDDLFITFEDLYSKYGDESYDHTSQTKHSDSRYNFVKSQHYLAFNDPDSEEEDPMDELNNNIYYNKSEAANDKKESKRIEANNGKGENVRTKVGIVGNQAFRFNNADQLATQEGYMTEYPFTLTKYANQTNPGAGAFIVAKFLSSETSTTTIVPKTFYVFATDETKYNIAPTTATQHRFYAFYKMIVEIVLADYDPIVNFEKVYEKTFYGDDATDPFYGVRVTAPSNIDTPLASDFATYKAIAQKIATEGDNKNVPKKIDQILYLDMSGLNGVYHSPVINTTDAQYAVNDFNDLKSKLATNALVFLPINSTDRFNNFAFAKKGEIAGSFQAANNIVLTDKQPFFSPYDIQVNAANYATYSRQITSDINGKASKATLILPFALSVTKGVHTNTTNNDGDIACSFSLNTMDASQNFSKNENFFDHPTAKFSPISGVWSSANTPYTVSVESADAVGNSLSFVATQYGATIAKTPRQSETSTLGQVFYPNETASGTYTYKSKQTGNNVSVDYTCKAEGNFCGVQYDREVSEDIFYFAANMFLNFHTLRAEEQYLCVYPFRSVYNYTGGGTGGALLQFFDVIFDDEVGDIDAIAEMPKQADLAVKSGKGHLSMTSAIDQTVSVRSLNGMTVGELNMRAGDSKTINLPAGIYVVNNVKIIVK